MQFKNEKLWNEAVANNTDPYGKAAIDFARQWADGMEAQMSQGEALEAIAENESRTADTEGITGFMYGCAVGILSEVWAHGEALRQWHNAKYDKTGRANAKEGAVINPAILTIG